MFPPPLNTRGSLEHNINVAAPNVYICRALVEIDSGCVGCVRVRLRRRQAQMTAHDNHMGQTHGKMNGHQINYAFLVVPLSPLWCNHSHMRPMGKCIGPISLWHLCNEYAILMSWNCALWAHIASSWKLSTDSGKNRLRLRDFSTFSMFAVLIIQLKMLCSSAWARRPL